MDWPLPDTTKAERAPLYESAESPLPNPVEGQV